MDRKIIKLSKTELNELLKRITEDNEEYGLALKLTYIYGRSIGEVSNLQKKDITGTEITFKINDEYKTYLLHPTIQSELEKQIELLTDEDYVFSNHKKLKDNLNYTLYRKTENTRELQYLYGLKLTTKDFRILRGQHLFQDGVSVKTVNELYCNKSLDSTKKLIKYYDLLNQDKSINTILEDYTDIKLYEDFEYSSYATYYCVNRGEEEAIIELQNEKIINIIGEEEIKKELMQLPLYNILGEITGIGEYKFYNGFKIMKN